VICLAGALCRFDGTLGAMDVLRAAHYSVWDLERPKRPLSADVEEHVIRAVPRDWAGSARVRPTKWLTTQMYWKQVPE